MLHFVFSFLTKSPSKKNISVYVDSCNISALHMYKKIGFSVLHPFESIIVNIFTTKRYFYMRANLEQYDEKVKQDEVSFQKVKVCILMNRFHVGANILLNKIIQDPNIEIVGIVWKSIWVTSKKKSQQNIFVSWMRWGEKIGHYFLLGFITIVILHFIQVILLEIFLLGILFKGRSYLRTTRGIAMEKGIPLIKTTDVNDEKTITAIKRLKPDILLSNNFSQILKKEIIEIPSIATINLHPGKLPFYRGLLPHFWAMVHGEQKGGVTLHYVDEGIDTGAVIDEKEFPIEKHDSFYSVWKKTAHHFYDLLERYFSKLRHGQIIQSKKAHSDRKGRLFSFPNQEAFDVFKKRGKTMLKFRDFINNFTFHGLSKKNKKNH